ncbi:hypothetical protein AKJ54_01025, partial [candidate division MSBL1 archaeon SCGC-AAA382K21]
MEGAEDFGVNMKKFLFIIIGFVLISFYTPNVFGDTFSDNNFCNEGIHLENTEVRVFQDEKTVSLRDNIPKDWIQTDWGLQKEDREWSPKSESMYPYWENVDLLENISLSSSGSKGIADHVLISELLYDPAGADDGKEWIELYNPTSNPIDIGNWKIQPWDGSDNEPLMSAILPSDASIPGHGFYLIAENGFTNA